MIEPTNTVTISITEADITDGMRGSKTDCAVARAAIRALGRAVMVESSSMRFADQLVDLPPTAILFIQTFDGPDRKKAKPFSFDIQVPTFLTT